MRRLLILMISLLVLPASQAWAQETAAPEQTEAAAASGPSDDTPTAQDDPEDPDASDDIDDSDLDLQTYDQDDDEFVPTEEIPADEAIPFPTDI